MTFGIYIVSYLIYLFSSMIISVAIGVVVGLISYFSTNNLHTTIAWVTGVLSILQHLFYIIFFVSVALNYFSLTERQDGEGLLRRLEGLGDHKAHSQTEEQY